MAADRASQHNKVAVSIALVIFIALIVVAYAATLLTHIAGSNDPFLEDGGEIQVALNIWGTLHGTSYPLFTVLGGLFVSIARTLGVNAATAPSLYALTWGLFALLLFYLLLRRLTGQPILAAVVTLLLAVTRGVWAYNVLPKTYSMSLTFFVAMLAVALWPADRLPWLTARRRFWLLALVSGVAVAHHRLLAFALPGALLAILPALWAMAPRGWQRWRWLLITALLSLPLALIGFTPYIYLPLRALAHAHWVYNDPSTLPGFWREFTAQESNYLFALPVTLQAWAADWLDTLRIVVEQCSPVGAVLIPLLAVYGAWRQRPARIALLCALPVLAFVLIWHRAVVAEAVVMPVVLLATFAAALGLADLLSRLPAAWRRYEAGGLMLMAGAALIGLIGWSVADLRAISSADEGQREIIWAQAVPRDGGHSVLTLPWGMRYSAVAFSHYVTGENADLSLADHNADFAGLLRDGHTLYTDRDTFYTLPLSWWDGRLGHAYLSAVPAADAVQIAAAPIPTAPLSADPPVTPIAVVDSLRITDWRVSCDAQQIVLLIHWNAVSVPTQDYSVFVHLIGAAGSDSGAVIATADESAPVYGWYPTDRWTAGETITDRYRLPRLPGATAVQFGLYQQPTPGQFVNYGVTTIALNSIESCQPQ